MTPISAMSVSRVRGADVLPLSLPRAGTDEPRAREEEMAEMRAAVTDSAMPADLAVLVDRLDACHLLADGDHALIAEMHALDPEGTAQLLRDMLGRA